MNILTAYLPGFPKTLLYMLQASEYDVNEYLAWINRTVDFRSVSKRKKLVWTNKIRLLALAEVVIILIFVIFAWFVSTIWIPLAIPVLIVLPVGLIYGILAPLVIGRVLIQIPREKKMINAATEKIAMHPAKKIAIVGSYGKTTAKEVLKTVLAEKYDVAATPGNMNTPIGISRFIMNLSGDEEVLVFEFGETHIGDIRQLCDIVHPDIGVITGINEAHLQSFKTIENTIATVFELSDFLKEGPVYANHDDANVRHGSKGRRITAFGIDDADGWSLVKGEATLEGDRIVAQKGRTKISAKTLLIGDHLFGVLMLAIALGEKLELSPSEIEAGLGKIRPFEHRMQPRELHGALIIDDTYNGNIRGIEAGLSLLRQSQATRKIYVTPGLVEQGSETEAIHIRIGELIAQAADIAVLMNNSVTPFIQAGIQKAEFKGTVKVVDDPLAFYSGLEYFVAAGDVVLMQNDWTDNYS